MTTPLSPDARNLVNNPIFFRECIFALMVQERASAVKLAKMMGVDIQRIRRYIHLEVTGGHSRTAMVHRYPEQYLVERMLDPDTRTRLLRLHVWTRKLES